MLIVTYIIYCNITTGVHIPLVHSENWQVCHFVPSAYKIVKTMYTSMNISALSNVLAMRVRPTLYYKTKVICVANTFSPEFHSLIRGRVMQKLRLHFWLPILVKLNDGQNLFKIANLLRLFVNMIMEKSVKLPSFSAHDLL